MAETIPTCGAVGPDGAVCDKKKFPHPKVTHWDSTCRIKWWGYEKTSTYQDPDDMSDGEWQAYGRFGY
jgi:hypothetical protein